MPFVGQAQRGSAHDGCEPAQGRSGAGSAPRHAAQAHPEKAWGKLMDEGVLSIRWDTGFMDIRLDSFFPCEQARFKKLLKVIDLDWEHCDTLKDTLKVYFQEKIPAQKERRKKLAVDLSNANQAVADLERLVKTRKKPVGVYLTKPELQQAKEDLRAAKERRVKLERAFKTATSDIPKLEKLLEIINKNIGGT